MIVPESSVFDASYAELHAKYGAAAWRYGQFEPRGRVSDELLPAEIFEDEKYVCDTYHVLNCAVGLARCPRQIFSSRTSGLRPHRPLSRLLEGWQSQKESHTYAHTMSDHVSHSLHSRLSCEITELRGCAPPVPVCLPAWFATFCDSVLLQA